MPTPLYRIASRVFDRPLLILPSRAELIANVLRDRLPAGATWEAEVDANQFLGTTKRADGSRALSRAAGSTAIITIDGELVNRGAWIGADSGLVSYEGLGAQLADAAADDQIRSIVLDINSPGGEVDGIANLGALIRAISAQKPVVAMVNDMAASAAYWIASQAREIVISPTSLVGSIGVVVLHLDRSEQYAKAGIKPTLIYAGDHKVDFSPFAPLSKGVLADVQKEIDLIYGLFLDDVAGGRGARLTRDAARATEARVYTGQQALDAGLADRIATLEDILEELDGGDDDETDAAALMVAARSASAAIAKPKETALRDANDGSQGAATDMADEATARTEALNAAASIIALCHAGGVDYLAEGFVKSGATVEAAKARITEAKVISEKVTTARKTCPQIDAALAEQYIVAGRTPESAAADLLERMTAIQARQGSQNTNHGGALDGAETVAVWDRAVAKVNARFERAAAAAS